MIYNFYCFICVDIKRIGLKRIDSYEVNVECLNIKMFSLKCVWLF